MHYLVRIPIQSYSDIITNSSSELFVFVNGNNTDVIRRMLNSYVKDWEAEYHPPILFKDLTESDKDTFIEYVFILPRFYNCDGDIDEYNKSVMNVIHRETLIPYEDIPKMFTNWNKPEITELSGGRELVMYYLEWSDYGKKILYDKYQNDVCLFSIGENPDWNTQEAISMFCGGERYHLG